MPLKFGFGPMKKIQPLVKGNKWHENKTYEKIYPASVR